MIIDRSKPYDTQLCDMRGIAYKVGDKVAKADSYGSSATLRVSEGTKMKMVKCIWMMSR
jgi:hypothetical protein